jgi:hypothetical protein
MGQGIQRAPGQHAAATNRESVSRRSELSEQRTASVGGVTMNHFVLIVFPERPGMRYKRSKETFRDGGVPYSNPQR